MRLVLGVIGWFSFCYVSCLSIAFQNDEGLDGIIRCFIMTGQYFLPGTGNFA